MIYEMSNSTSYPELNEYSAIDTSPNMAALKHQLDTRNFPSIKISSEVLEDHNHFSFFPNLISRGLVWGLSYQATFFEEKFEKFIALSSQ